ncbi:hypothetical protein ACRS3X_07640 [Ectopseudomonas hydrolytica]|uniref:hypothetical protein n=1 Tax=Ectopseudomonas hydrolytica TaxID=2493633 RepID=UPI003EE31B1C
MLIDPLKLFSPSCFRIPEAQQGDLVVTDEGEPEATDDGALVRFEQAADEL